MGLITKPKIKCDFLTRNLVKTSKQSESTDTEEGTTKQTLHYYNKHV